ncbi:hypothetical protein WPG_0365 [Winogradskyella sp. PG-2]|nr:hypothetical protein WPG_0365 [Winogradskyella sp. PG-2]
MSGCIIRSLTSSNRCLIICSFSNISLQKIEFQKYVFLWIFIVHKFLLVLENNFFHINVIGYMRRQVASILNYYKSMALYSFMVTLTVTIINPELILAISTKLFLVFILWFMISDRKLRRRLRFYKISGVSNLKFFSVIFLLDGFITCTFIHLIKGFI